MHDNVVRREHLVDIVERHALGSARGAGGLQTHHFVVNMRLEINGRVGGVGVFDIALIQHMSLGQVKFFACCVDGDNHLGLVFAERQRLERGFNNFGVVEIDLCLVVGHDLGGFTRGEIEVDGVADGAELLRRDIAEQKLRRVIELEHHDVRLLHAVLLHGVGKTVAVGVKLRIGPLLFFYRRNNSGLVAKAAHIAHKAVQPGEFRFKGFLKHGVVIGVSHKIPRSNSVTYSERRGDSYAYFPIRMLEFCPPKPKALDMA